MFFFSPSQKMDSNKFFFSSSSCNRHVQQIDLLHKIIHVTLDHVPVSGLYMCLLDYKKKTERNSLYESLCPMGRGNQGDGTIPKRVYHVLYFNIIYTQTLLYIPVFFFSSFCIKGRESELCIFAYVVRSVIKRYMCLNILFTF